MTSFVTVRSIYARSNQTVSDIISGAQCAFYVRAIIWINVNCIVNACFFTCFYEICNNIVRVWTAAGDLMAVSKGIEAQGIEVKGAELTMVPTTPTAVSGADAKKVQRLIDRLEDLDDVQDVYSTMDMTDEVIAALEEE